MVQAVTPITTHAADALARLLQQFKGKEFIAALLNAINAQVQQFENDVDDLSDVLDIDLMGGVNLNNIGDVVAQLREGRIDADYRQAIRDKISRNAASGTPDQLIDIFDVLTGSTLSSIQLIEVFPAGYVIYGDAASYPSDILASMDAATGAAIYVGIGERLIEEGSSDLITTEAGDAILLTPESTSG
jgi:hypothetical protein